MDEKERGDVENLRDQIVSLKEQLDCLAKSQQSILSAQRIRLEQYRTESIKLYTKKMLKVLDSAIDQTQSEGKWLRELGKLQQELEALASRESPHSADAEEISEVEKEKPEDDEEAKSKASQADKPSPRTVSRHPRKSSRHRRR